MHELDPEIQAMGEVVVALDRLDDDQKRSRVLRWAADRYGVLLTPHHGGRLVPTNSLADLLDNDTNTIPRPADTRPTSHTPPERRFDEFVDLFDAVDPQTDVDKALTGAYWLQVISGQPSWQSLRVNNLLKDTGHSLANVTSTLRSAQERKPALVRQVGKSGRSAQAWKQYKLTTSGVAYMRRKLGLTQAVPVALQDSDDDDK